MRSYRPIGRLGGLILPNQTPTSSPFVRFDILSNEYSSVSQFVGPV